MAWKDENRRSN